MYNAHVKAITITIPHELNASAAAEARRRGISKSELIRCGLAAVLPATSLRPNQDPWYELSGFADERLDTKQGEIDEVVYGA